MTKIDIFSGFLGAGKTTLIKKLLKEAYAGEKVVLIENEFGEIGIDGGFLKDSGIQINEMNSGCICCSLVADFSRSFLEVLEHFHPDRVLVEPSGVGKLSDVIRAVEDAGAKDAVLNGIVTVVDAKKCKMYMKNFGEFFCDQVESAATIVLSHTDGLPQDKLAACLALLREHNDKATMVTTPWDVLDGKQILSAVESRHTIEDSLYELEEEQRAARAHHEHHQHHREHHYDYDEKCTCGCHDHDYDHEHEHHHHDHDEECACGCHDHDHEHEHHHHDHDERCTCGCHGHHHADEVFSSFGEETTKKFTRQQIADALRAFSSGTEFGTVLRAKGIVAAEDGSWIHFDYVPGEPDIRTGAPDVIGRLCVIGADLDHGAIRKLFL